MEDKKIPEKLLSPYSPTDTEEKIQKLWEESAFFNPDTCIKTGKTDSNAESFSMVLPPPNVTGTLHVGHSFMIVIEDILARYNRMQGKRTLWIPGTDHAAIATQSKVEKLLSKKKIRKHDLGREKFLEEVETFAQESHDTIVSQVKKMGASVDWSREAFTLDEKREKAVRTAFKKMYDDGLIYRKDKVVNWDPKGQTTVSDDEVVHEERKAILYTFRYAKDFPIPVATTRLETKVGDTAVAVHPTDERYKKFIGQTFDIEFLGIPLSIEIIGDEEIDPEFGTGAVGVTPAHSQTDWDIAQRHNLPLKQVINEYAKMDLDADWLDGKKTTEARELLAGRLKEEGLIEKEEEITQNVSTAERTGGIIEPLPKLQWFIDVNKEFILPHSNLKSFSQGDTVTLKKLMRDVVENNEIEILPDNFKKVYFNWIENLHDWCISRQIWYGHQIPVWYKDGETHVGLEAPEKEGWEQDPDTLDTWFSSGLWTFSTLGWPEKTKDFEKYHPLDVMETGYDILFFWVARMILMSTYLLGDIPFKQVYLHGLVRDGKGKKMSKSDGNVVDPLDIIDEFGSDALRMGLIVGTGPGQDSKLSPEKIKAYKHFANKLWNITRFILSKTQEHKEKPILSKNDKALLEELQGTIQDITDDIDNLRLHLASEKLYAYTWHRLADEILEESKNILEKDDTEAKSRSWTLRHILETIVTALHPFMPHITEEVWSLLPGEHDLLVVTKWPK